MTTNAASILSFVDASVLTPIVRQSLGGARLAVSEWQATRAGSGVGNPVSLGIYRFEGIAQDGLQHLPWSVILKLVQSPANIGFTDMGEGDDPTHWNYWRRELLAYQSGILDTLPPGLVAPRCYGAVELDGDVAGLWLEDVGSPDSSRWSLDRYALAARHLGRLNGTHRCEDQLPSYPWLGRERLRQWLARPELQQIAWNHPWALTHYRGGESNCFRRMLAEQDRFLARLDRLPLTLAHGDTYPTNFTSRPAPGGETETVALDWALIGLEPLGADLGQLAFGMQNNLPDAPAEVLTERLFQSYMAGLRDSGCQLDQQHARFGFVTSAAFRIGLFQLFLLSMGPGEDDASPEHQSEATPAADPFEVSMAREAYTLLDAI